MTLFNRWLIWTHRYLGIPLSVLFVLWFASGIVMLYTGDMPRLAPQERLERLAPLDLSHVRLTPAAAATRARLGRPPTRAALLTVAGRPAYRFGGTTVFADTGGRMPPLEPAAAREVAARFSRTPTDAVHHLGLVERPDQWTLVAREALPAYRFRVDDAAGTELYVARRTAEVAMVTTRRTRLLAWLGAIPHWFYLPALRVDRPLWEAVIVWTSAFGCLIAITGLLLGLTRFRWRPSRKREPRIPYAGPMWWHHLTGLVFGIATLTWVFSGLLSVQPFAWMTLQGVAVPPAALGGGPPVLADFPAIDPSAWAQATAGRTVKEIGLRRIDGAPHYEVTLAGGDAAAHHPEGLLLAADTLAPRTATIGVEQIVERLGAALPDVPVTDAAWLESYDGYYYGRGADGPPLPVIRVRFADPLETWVYVDPADLRVTGSVHRFSRLERWLFNGLHSLDFAFWYDRRPLWDAGMIALSLGGLASSAIGLWIGAGRLRRGIGRLRSSVN